MNNVTAGPCRMDEPASCRMDEPASWRRQEGFIHDHFTLFLLELYVNYSGMYVADGLKRWQLHELQLERQQKNL